MQEVTLAVRDLHKVIGKKEIIKGINFEIKQGEVFGFLGPNGAGKTTTIRMIVGLIKPTSGSIHICGRDVQTEFPEAMANLGCIVENPELYPFLTGMENLQQFARMQNGVGEERISEVIQLVRLQQRIQDKVKTYSLGMRQRLGIAQALLGRPKILILDEPTNGLDPSGIREMREFIRYLAEKEELSVLVSSHLLSEIQLMCDRVAIIAKGRIISVEAVDKLLSQQERLIWRLTPTDQGLALLKELTGRARVEGETIITPYDEDAVGCWNQRLVEAGVKIKEMHRHLPALEDLFLEMTGGESVD